MAVGSISNVSNVSFKANALDKVTPELISQPGIYADSPVAPASPAAGDTKQKKGGSFLGTITKGVLKLAGLAAVAIAARKYIPALQKIQVGTLAEDAKPLEKAKHYFAKYTDLGYQKLEQGVDKVLSYFVKAKPEEAAPAGINTTA